MALSPQAKLVTKGPLDCSLPGGAGRQGGASSLDGAGVPRRVHLGPPVCYMSCSAFPPSTPSLR